MHEFHIRASAFADLFDCAYRFEGVHIMGMKKPTSGRAHLGSSLHHSTAKIDSGVMSNSPLSIEESSDAFMDYYRNPEEEVDWLDLDVRQGEYIGLKLNSMYQKDWSHRFNFLSVERKIDRLAIDTDEGITIVLRGTLDRCRTVKGKNGKSIVDIKTGKNAIYQGKASTRHHGIQLGSYELLEEFSTGNACTEPSAIIGMKTSGSLEIASSKFSSMQKDMLIGDEHNKGLLEIGAKMARTGLFPPNPKSLLCDKRYCPRWDYCSYHE